MASAEDIQGLVKTTLGEIERILSTRAVVGEPMTVEGNILIPLISIGFGFGSGGMAGKGMRDREGGGTGVGGGGFVRPVAVVVIAKDGTVKVEPARGVIVPVTERVMELVSKVIDRRWPKPEGEQKGE